MDTEIGWMDDLGRSSQQLFVIPACLDVQADSGVHGRFSGGVGLHRSDERLGKRSELGRLVRPKVVVYATLKILPAFLVSGGFSSFATAVEARDPNTWPTFSFSLR